MKDKTTCNRNARRTRALVEGAFLELMKHEEIFRILFSKNGDIDFIYKLATTMGDGLYKGWSSYYGDQIPKEMEMYVSYVAFDMIGMLLKNLQLNAEWPPEKMGHLAGEVTNWLDEGLCGSDKKTKHEVK